MYCILVQRTYCFTLTGTFGSRCMKISGQALARCSPAPITRYVSGHSICGQAEVSPNFSWNQFIFILSILHWLESNVSYRCTFFTGTACTDCNQGRLCQCFTLKHTTLSSVTLGLCSQLSQNPTAQKTSSVRWFDHNCFGMTCTQLLSRRLTVMLWMIVMVVYNKKMVILKPSSPNKKLQAFLFLRYQLNMFL